MVNKSGENRPPSAYKDWRRMLQYSHTKYSNILIFAYSYSPETTRNFESTLDWLHEHACSRQYGLGERI